MYPTPAPASLFAGPLPSSPPFRPSADQLLQTIRDGQQPCSYCPVERKRPAYRVLAASELQPDGSTRTVVRFICGACDIMALDLVLGAPGAPGVVERMRELEELVQGLREDVAAARRQSA